MENIKIPNLTSGKYYIPDSIEIALALSSGIKNEMPLFGGYNIDQSYTEFTQNDFNYFLSKKDLELFQEYSNSPNLFNDNQLDSYFFEYAKGFQKGYFEFESKIKPTDLFKDTEADTALRIFKRVFLISNYDVGTRQPFSDNIKFIDDFYVFGDLESSFSFGVIGGEIYKAWEIIINNPSKFEPIFLREFSKSKSSKNIDQTGILSFKDWFVEEEYIDLIFEQLKDIFEILEPRKKAKYIGEKKDEASTTAACYFASIMIERGWLKAPIKRSSKMNQRKFLKHLSEFFEVEVSEQHYSKFTDFEILNKDHICYKEIEGNLNSINV